MLTNYTNDAYIYLIHPISPPHVAATIHTVWDGLLQIVGYTALLLCFLGPSMFAGIAAMVVILPLNAHFLIALSKLKEENLKLTDRRVKLTNELLQVRG
jgi:ATP-binding cassette subfamily C (CFTR/MRP) protein 1